MKIAVWNLERPKLNQKRIRPILEKLRSLDADILILTETNSAINPGSDFNSITSEKLGEKTDGIDYSEGENRTTIWTKFEIAEKIETCDNFTTVCAKLKTPVGELIVYGCITGIFGGIGQRFKSDFENQSSDWKKFAPGANICIAGDFNTMLSGHAYPSKMARNDFLDICEKLDLEIPTKEIPRNVDHIFISRKMVLGKNIGVEIWNEDFLWSDHIGILISIS
ncbi:endonuclease/exonuclease/phosphatase family protein [Flavobacterium sp.]|uniref:endonuclease/exonuclease/phosphatase family protein n=1 Tax=Flavobacterium sp. TaxID=239 RepID=UPI00120ABADA|nr:endonuclease/exonuclease/phosphatase family protein [Flavobacterium sp.]RZJ72120.1 MAG: endonuclease/exonuclease/phosphatase family protein [Flavobacterium sp.]